MASSTSTSPAMDDNTRVWIWEARAKLSWGKTIAEIENWLDLELECLRETLKESYCYRRWPRSDAQLYMPCMDALTSLRYSNPWCPEWVTTALPSWEHTAHGEHPVHLVTHHDVPRMLDVISFFESLETRLNGIELNWKAVRVWLESEYAIVLQGELDLLD